MSPGGIPLASPEVDTVAKRRVVLGATLAAGPGDFVVQLPHLSDGGAAPAGFRGTPALSSQDGKDRGGNWGGREISAPGEK